MKKELRNIFISRILVGLVSGFLMVGLPLYLLNLGFDISSIGTIFGIAILFYAFLSFYLGSLSEFKGRLKIGMYALVGLIISSSLFSIIPLLAAVVAFVIFVIAKLLFNTSESIFGNIVKIRILDLTRNKKLGSAYGALILAISLGYGIGILLGSFALLFVSFQFVFVILTILLVISVIFYSKTGDIKTRTIKRKNYFSGLFKAPKLFKIVLLINTVLVVGSYLVDFFGLPLYQKEILGMQNEQIFILLGSAWLIYGIFSHLGGKVYDKYGIKTFAISMFLISIMSFLLAVVKDVTLFAVILIIDYIFFAFADPARFALAGLASRKSKGVLLSSFEFFSLVIAGLIMLAFGQLVSLFKFEFIFYVRAAVQIIAILLLIPVHKMLKKR